MNKPSITAGLRLQAQAELELRRRRGKGKGMQNVWLERARSNMMDFTNYTFPAYNAEWYHKEICRELDNFYQDVLDEKSPRLMIFAPPRHGKTELVSRRFPAWVFGRNPDISIISSSYNSELATRNNRDVQRIMDDERYEDLFPDSKLFGKNIKTVAYNTYLRNSEMFEIVNHKGVYRAAGVGNGITGMGAHILIIDDPIRDAEQAYSAVYRNKVWEWYTTTAYTRLTPGGGLLLILTRWHEDDLAGRLLRAARDEGDKWKVLKYPAIAEEEEENRSEGDALFPQKYNIEKLTKIKNSIGSIAWASMYQQRPQVAGGGLFKKSNFRYYHKQDGIYILRDGDTSRHYALNSMVVFTTMDLAARSSEKSDYTAIGVWGLTRENDLVLLDMVREHLEGASHLELVWAVHNKWKPQEHNIESVQYQITLIQQALRQGLPAKELKTGMKDKTTRALSVAAKIEGHKVFFPQDMSWVIDLEDELVAFPNGRNDDMVDVVAYAALRAEFLGKLALPKLPAQSVRTTDRFSMPKLIKSY